MEQEIECLESQWRVCEGVMVAPDLDPNVVEDRLKTLSIVAEVNWNPATKHLISISVLVNDSDAIATLSGDKAEYDPGMTLSELVRCLGSDLKAMVGVGRYSHDGVPEGAVWPEVYPDREIVTRTVEITNMSAASIPFCAAVGGVDLGTVELSDGLRAVLYEAPGRNFGDSDMMTEVPVLALSVDVDNMRLVAIESDKVVRDSELIMHSFTLNSKIISGSGHLDATEFEKLRTDMGRGQMSKRIANIVPNCDVDQLAAGLRERGEQGMRTVIKALRLPCEVEAFLLDGKPMEEVATVCVHEARGWSNAIGRSVDMLLKEPESLGGQFWSTYHRAVVEKPWIVRTVAVIEAAVGASLLTIACKAKSPRSGWVKLGVLIGSLLMVDVVAEISLAKYLGGRAERSKSGTIEN